MATTVTSPSIKAEYSEGNVRVVLAIIGQITNSQTWDVPLGSITAVFVEANASGATHGYTASGGTVTFLTSGTVTNAAVKVYGY